MKKKKKENAALSTDKKKEKGAHPKNISNLKTTNYQFLKMFFPYRVEEEIEQQGMGHPLGWGRFWLDFNLVRSLLTSIGDLFTFIFNVAALSTRGTDGEE